MFISLVCYYIVLLQTVHQGLKIVEFIDGILVDVSWAAQELVEARKHHYKALVSLRKSKELLDMVTVDFPREKKAQEKVSIELENILHAWEEDRKLIIELQS